MILNILFYILLLFISLILVLIFYPISYQLEIDYEKMKNHLIKFRIGSLFFSFVWQFKNGSGKKIIRLMGKKIKEEHISVIEDKKELVTDERKESLFKTIPPKVNKKNLQLFWKKRKHIYCHFSKFLKLLKPNSLQFNCLWGCEDPYYNGILLAGYYSIKETFPEYGLNFAIDWESTAKKVSGELVGDIILAHFIWLMICFIFSRQTILIFTQLYKHRKTSK